MQTAQFITEEFAKRKARNPNFSIRAFAKWLDVSPAQLSQLMTGKRPLTPKTMNKIVNRLGLSPFEQRELAATVLKQEQPTIQKREALSEDRFRLIADWYHLAILSLTKVKGAKADPRWIARRLGISVEEANQAIVRLERLGIISTKPMFKQIAEPFEVTSEIPSQAIQRFHKQNLQLAIEKLDTVPVHARQFQTVSINLEPSQVLKFKKFIDEFLDSAASKFENSKSNEIYNLNVQLFPVTKLEER